jgi:hypothetical protein
MQQRVQQLSTAVEYSNASDLERRQEASSDPRPALTTLTNRLGTSSHRGVNVAWRLRQSILAGTGLRITTRFDNTSVSCRRVIAGSNYPRRCTSRVQQPRRPRSAFIRPCMNRSPAPATCTDPMPPDGKETVTGHTRSATALAPYRLRPRDHDCDQDTSERAGRDETG